MSAAARQIAEASQRQASDPSVSAFVSASAGSGKTKLLTDRLLRLMLAGAPPGRIQCLTFTKAGAAEMAVRLQERLGEWVTADDATLDKALTALDLVPTGELRGQARRLFAEVLDLPGGMRIETIHAFCQSLLRRFPLEAAISPHFEILDEARARDLQQAAREAALAEADPEAAGSPVPALSPQVQLEAFTGLLKELQGQRERLEAALAGGVEALIARQLRVLGLAPWETEQTLLAGAVAALDLPRLRRALGLIGTVLETKPHARVGAKLPAALAWLAAAPPNDHRAWHDWAAYFLNADNGPCSPKNLVSEPAEKAHPGLRAFLTLEQERVCAVLERLRALEVARLSAALLRLAEPCFAAYDARKQRRGWLDYQDLIARTRALLHDPGTAWVLYKLDGGLDHLLLDEVQDTAPDQWLIANALTEEFFAGSGGRAEGPLARSVFAVGDHKQSIFSFQGAAPEKFDYWRQRIGARIEAAGQRFLPVQLAVSFRSTTPVLALVDAVFADADLLGLGQTAPRHIADRADQAGCVEIWPLAPLPDRPEPLPWEPPETARGALTAPQRLAEALAARIAAEIDDGRMLQSRGRAVHAGDYLILVRSRGSFDRALLGALKARGVAVAGLDRMVLTEQPAVADLLSLCEVLLLPEDELALACVLTSPLGGLSDASLMALALGRRGGLWGTLRARAGERADWGAAWAFLAALYARVDYVTPHALLAEALGRLGGRARCYARLGPQAGEAIDELLSAAIAYAARQAPSLQGFVQHVRRAGAEVVRQAETEAREVRIMTVHGAKGLQAPVVILPASAGLATQRAGIVWADDAGQAIPLWVPRQELRDEVVRATALGRRNEEREEHYRLLYVALTRAEDRLIVCGWESARAKEECWYDVVRAAASGLPGMETGPFEAWDGEVLRVTSPQRADPVRKAQHEAGRASPLPGWAGEADGWRATPPPAEPALPVALAPSRPQDASLGGVPAAASPLAARDATGARFARGQMLHSLLQHLPNHAPEDRADAARRFLGRAGGLLDAGEAARLAGEVVGLLARDDLAPLFGPGSRAEVPLTGVIATAAGPVVVGGLVDRLVELPDAILVADFKTNRAPPATIEATPALYLRQMASYRAVLATIFPDRPIRCALIWTHGGRADWLDSALLDSHAPGAGKTLDPAGIPPNLGLSK